MEYLSQKKSIVCVLSQNQLPTWFNYANLCKLIQRHYRSAALLLLSLYSSGSVSLKSIELALPVNEMKNTHEINDVNEVDESIQQLKLLATLNNRGKWSVAFGSYHERSV